MIDEILPPHHCTALIGHAQAQRQFEEAYDAGRLHHAWLMTGAEGIGKASLAFMMAQMILSGGENRLGRHNPDHPAAHLIRAQAHPDLLVLQRPVDEKTGLAKNTIPVEEARKLGPFLSLTSSQGKGRVAIIDEAHLLNRNGQNAILKMIEEPPSGATILLTATTTGMMLPTIRSRCRVLTLSPLKESEITTILARQSVNLPEGAARTRLFALAQGSVGMVLKILRAEALPLLDELMALLAAMPMLDLVRVHALADQIAKKADTGRFEVVSRMLLQTLQEAVRAASLGQTDAAGLAPKLVRKGNLDEALTLWDSLSTLFATSDTANLDRKLTFINALSAISRTLA